MDEQLRQFVRERAKLHCEYCRLPQTLASSIRFHIEHIRPIQHGGTDEPSNLALACPNCNWNKGPNISAVDPESGNVVLLFNPRMDVLARALRLRRFGNPWSHADRASHGELATVQFARSD